MPKDGLLQSGCSRSLLSDIHFGALSVKCQTNVSKFFHCKTAKSLLLHSCHSLRRAATAQPSVCVPSACRLNVRQQRQHACAM